MLTKKDLELIGAVVGKTLDVRFAAQDKRIDEKFDVRFAEQDKRIDEKFDVRFAEQDKRIDEQFDVRFAEQDKKIDGKFSEFRTDFRRELHEDMQQMIRAAEAGMIRRIDESQQAILDAISEVVMPEVQEHTREITKIKHHFRLA